MTLPASGEWIAALAGLAGLACGVLLYRQASRLLHRIRLQRRFSRGARGEMDAEVFLTRHGYRIIATQARRELRMIVDGAPVRYEIRADFIVRKKNKTYVVEVKTGAKAVDPVSTDTRRQLLEYAFAYRADAVRLFDADAGVLHEVELPIERSREGGGKQTVLIGMATGAVLTISILFLIGMLPCKG